MSSAVRWQRMWTSRQSLIANCSQLCMRRCQWPRRQVVGKVMRLRCRAKQNQRPARQLSCNHQPASATSASLNNYGYCYAQHTAYCYRCSVVCVYVSETTASGSWNAFARTHVYTFMYICTHAQMDGQPKNIMPSAPSFLSHMGPYGGAGLCFCSHQTTDTGLVHHKVRMLMPQISLVPNYTTWWQGHKAVNNLLRGITLAAHWPEPATCWSQVQRLPVVPSSPSCHPTLIKVIN